MTYLTGGEESVAANRGMNGTIVPNSSLGQSLTRPRLLEDGVSELWRERANRL